MRKIDDGGFIFDALHANNGESYLPRIPASEIRDFQDVMNANLNDEHGEEWLDAEEEETLTIMDEIEFWETFAEYA